jgi:exodeoxyribonuclease VII large subunit
MQGQQVEAEILSCLNSISKKKDEYDAVAIIRGGGGRIDLAAFDNLSLAIKVAEFPIPVLIGIGHEIDQSVLDLVAFNSLKTPTAVADFIIDHNSTFENGLDEILQLIREETMERVRSEKQKVENISRDLQQAVHSRIVLEDNKLQHTIMLLRHASRNMIAGHHKRIEFINTLLEAIDPDRVLARGYTITSVEGKSVTHSSELYTGMSIQTTFHDGMVKSKVE